MAELRVKDEWVGPGEKKTAEHLRDTLPDDWVIFAGRKLAGENRDDVDLIVVGHGKIFVLDEKSWGPRIVVDDSYWYVNGRARQNPLGRVGQLARKIATKLKDHASGTSRCPASGSCPGSCSATTTSSSSAGPTTTSASMSGSWRRPPRKC